MSSQKSSDIPRELLSYVESVRALDGFVWRTSVMGYLHWACDESPDGEYVRTACGQDMYPRDHVEAKVYCQECLSAWDEVNGDEGKVLDPAIKIP